jgi:hypothetical protein
LKLIDSPNGVDKTTKIEGLNHTCTWELPLNARSGHSFIDDHEDIGVDIDACIELVKRTAKIALGYGNFGEDFFPLVYYCSWGDLFIRSKLIL